MIKKKIPRNGLCPCGSGKKAKHCCLGAEVKRVPLTVAKAYEMTELQRAMVSHQAGHLEAAAAIYDSLLEHVPEHADALHWRGVIDFQCERHDAAISKISLAIRHHRADARYFYHLGCVYLATGALESAIDQFRLALAIDVAYADAHGNLATALRGAGDLPGAVASYRNALALRPDDAGACNNLGATLHDLGEIEAGFAMLCRGLELTFGSEAEGHLECFSLLRAGHAEEAIAFFLATVAPNPLHASLYANLGLSLSAQLRIAEAIASFRAALVLRPDYAEAHSNLLFALQYAPGYSPHDIYVEHCRFASRFEEPYLAMTPIFRNSRFPDRRLKVGYVSADFRNHAVATFIEPILARHNAEHFEIFCYYNHHEQDAVTARLQGYAHHWRPCADLRDEQLEGMIRADGIDILIDLAGHTAHNRLPVFARKPAPLQVSWIGYPGTTGLTRMDYYIADQFFLPAGQFDTQFTEKIVRVSGGSSFLPYEAAPEVNPLPALRAGALTFGSFNQLGKLSAEVVGLWSQLLRALPNTTMLFGAMPPDGSHDRLVALFAREGVQRHRLHFHLRCDIGSYLALHHQVDICLDTFPYNGGTTTLHALWMGVPTLSLAGQTIPGRSGAAILGNAGLAEFIAADPRDFLAKGVAWAGDLPKLAHLRAGLRQRFARSPMCQPDHVTAGVENALRVMWQRWCAVRAPETFDVAGSDESHVVQEEPT